MSSKWLWIPPALALAFLAGALALFAAEPDPRPSGEEIAPPSPSEAPRSSPLPPPVFRAAPSPAFGSSPPPMPRLPPQMPPSVAPAPGSFASPMQAVPPPPGTDDEMDPAGGARGPRGPGSRPIRMRGGPHAAETE